MMGMGSVGVVLAVRRSTRAQLRIRGRVGYVTPTKQTRIEACPKKQIGL